MMDLMENLIALMLKNKIYEYMNKKGTAFFKF